MPVISLALYRRKNVTSTPDSSTRTAPSETNVTILAEVRSVSTSRRSRLFVPYVEIAGERYLRIPLAEILSKKKDVWCLTGRRKILERFGRQPILTQEVAELAFDQGYYGQMAGVFRAAGHEQFADLLLNLRDNRYRRRNPWLSRQLRAAAIAAMVTYSKEVYKK